MAKTLPSNTFTIRCFNPTRDLYGYIECRFAQNTLSETTIRNLHPKRDDEHPCPFIWESPPRATYMSAGLQDLKNVLFAHLEQEDFLLGRVTFEPEGYMQVSHLVTKSLAKAKKQWSCMGKQNVKAAYPKDNLEFKPSSNIFAMS